jgi:hypothetical protein
VDDQSPDQEDIHTMRSNNPLVLSHRAAEAAGYPALLLLTLLCLTLTVVAIALVGMIETVWALVWAVLTMLAAAVILTVGTYVTLDDDEEPVAEGTIARSWSSEPEAVVPLPRDPARPQQSSERKAA